MPQYDVLIVGGGPAGLSAALVLGRCRRRVLVVDAGNPRNVASHGIHAFLTRDGIVPADFLDLARKDVLAYGAHIRSDSVQRIRGSDGAFETDLGSGQSATSRKVLLATGVVDRIPPIPGIEDFYGKSVHHCPYCDAWEHKDGRVAVYGQGKAAAVLAIKMKVWTADVALCTGGPGRIPEPQRGRLARHGIPVYAQPVSRLEGTVPQLERIVFQDGSRLDRTALFFATGNVQRSDLIAQLGVKTSAKGKVKVTEGQRCGVRGVFVCGDAAEDAQFVIVAAAHGTRAGVAINTDLFESDFA